MNMQDLEGRIIKISAHTITVKDEDGKTRGMVRDVRPWKDTPLNQQTDIFRNLKAAGAWGVIKTGRIFWYDGGFWYIKNDHSRLYWGDNPPDITRPEIDREETHAQLAAAAGMPLPPCKCGGSATLRYIKEFGQWAIECSKNGHIHNTGFCGTAEQARNKWEEYAKLGEGATNV